MKPKYQTNDSFHMFDLFLMDVCGSQDECLMRWYQKDTAQIFKLVLVNWLDCQDIVFPHLPGEGC